MGDRRRLLLFGTGTLALVVVLWVVPDVFSFKVISLATSWLIFAGLVFGVDLVHGSLKLMSLAHVAIWALAAYAVIVFQSRFGSDFWVASLGAIALCAVAAVPIALIAFRTSGYYFAIFTFVIAEFIRLGFSNDVAGLTGGNSGLFYFKRPTVLGASLLEPGAFFHLTLICLAAVLVFTQLVRASDFGWKCRAVGESRELAEALGIDTYRAKIGIFTLSAIPAAVSGVLYGMFSGAINPDLFGPDVGIGTVLAAILGGTGTLTGPLLGSAIYIFGPAVLPLGPNIVQGVLGLIFILTIRFSPAGLAPRLFSLGTLAARRLPVRWPAALPSAGRSRP